MVSRYHQHTPSPRPDSAAERAAEARRQAEQAREELARTLARLDAVLLGLTPTTEPATLEGPVVADRRSVQEADGPRPEPGLALSLASPRPEFPPATAVTSGPAPSAAAGRERRPFIPRTSPQPGAEAVKSLMRTRTDLATFPLPTAGVSISDGNREIDRDPGVSPSQSTSPVKRSTPRGRAAALISSVATVAAISWVGLRADPPAGQAIAPQVAAIPAATPAGSGSLAAVELSPPSAPLGETGLEELSAAEAEIPADAERELHTDSSLAVIAEAPASLARSANIYAPGYSGVNVRQSPTAAAPIVRVVPAGTRVEMLRGVIVRDGRTWQQIRLPGGAIGWVSARTLLR